MLRRPFFTQKISLSVFLCLSPLPVRATYQHPFAEDATLSSSKTLFNDNLTSYYALKDPFYPFPEGFMGPILGIYLGPSQLTSSYYNNSSDPILLAKVEANPEWRALVLSRAQEYNPTKLCHQEKYILNSDPIWGICGAILPPFMEAMNQILEATSELLPKETIYKIGYIVIPDNMTDYEQILDYTMHTPFPFYHNFDEFRDYEELDIIRLGVATKYAYNLTNPDTLGAPRAPNGRINWEVFGEHGEIFADDDNWILVVNLEPGFLELQCVCGWWICNVPGNKSAILVLEEDALWPHDEESRITEGDGRVESRIQRLSSAILGFVDQYAFPKHHELLRVVVLAGGASSVALDAMRTALFDALPFVEERWRFMTNVDPAFVPSLGAALKIRNEVLRDRHNREIEWSG